MAATKIPVLLVHNFDDYLQSIKLSRRGRNVTRSQTSIPFFQNASKMPSPPLQSTSKEKNMVSVMKVAKINTEEFVGNKKLSSAQLKVKQNTDDSKNIIVTSAVATFEGRSKLNRNKAEIDARYRKFGSQVATEINEDEVWPPEINRRLKLLSENQKVISSENQPQSKKHGSEERSHFTSDIILKLKRREKPARKLSKVFGNTSNSHDSKKEKDNYCRHVFAINGSAMAFKQSSSTNFSHWFGDEPSSPGTKLSRSKKSPSLKSEDFLHVLDLSGFTNQEISMKIYDGNKLIIQATRPGRSKFTPMTTKHKIILPVGLSVDSLYLSRNEEGHLFIRQNKGPPVDSKDNLQDEI